MNSQVSLRVCVTEITDRFTMIDTLMAETANHYDAACFVDKG